MKTQEERIQRVVDRLIDDLAVRLKDGPVDLMSTYAKPLPIAMIASLMGIPDEELPALGRHGDAIGAYSMGCSRSGISDGYAGPAPTWTPCSCSWPSGDDGAGRGHRR